MISMRQETERETALVDTLRPRISIFHGNSDDDQVDTISESESNCSEQWYELGWSRTRSSDQSERCTKETSTCDKIETILPKRWRPCKEHRKIYRWVEESGIMQSMWCHRSLGRRLLTACQKRHEEITLFKGQRKKSSVHERNLMVKDVEVHRTTRLWKSTMMFRKIKRYI